MSNSSDADSRVWTLVTVVLPRIDSLLHFEGGSQNGDDIIGIYSQYFTTPTEKAQPLLRRGSRLAYQVGQTSKTASSGREPEVGTTSFVKKVIDKFGKFVCE